MARAVCTLRIVLYSMTTTGTATATATAAEEMHADGTQKMFSRV